MVQVPKFNEWIKLREEKLPQGAAASKPHSPRGKSMVKGHKDDISSGVRSHVDDLGKLGSGDYPGHIAHNGEEAPFKCAKKKGKKVADVAK